MLSRKSFAGDEPNSRRYARELRDTFISNRMGRIADRYALGGHRPSGLDEAKLLLELQRRDKGHRAEMLMERRDAHPGDFSQMFHRERLGVFGPDDRHGPRDPVCMAVVKAKRTDKQVLR
jgi:hypothetical protein